MNTELLCEVLPQDHGIKLGDGTGFPHPEAASTQELERNILYCKLNLQMVDGSVTTLVPYFEKFSLRVS